MKVVLIVVGLLGGLYAFVGTLQMIGLVFSANPRTTAGASNLAAGVVPVCLGLIVCIVCFRRAFRRAKSDDESGSDSGAVNP